MKSIRDTQREIARFWSKVDKTEGCWTWTGSTNHGYGQFYHQYDRTFAHRYSYELSNGPIPSGAHIDHKCHNRACVNPEHLRTVTNKQNHENRAGAQSNSSSGVRGVHWVKRRNRWCAQVGSKYIGSYLTMAEAEVAVIAKRNELFTHNVLDRIPA